MEIYPIGAVLVKLRPGVRQHSLTLQLLLEPAFCTHTEHRPHHLLHPPLPVRPITTFYEGDPRRILPTIGPHNSDSSLDCVGLVTRRCYDRRLKHRLRPTTELQTFLIFLTCVQRRWTHLHHWSFDPLVICRHPNHRPRRTAVPCTSSARNNTSAVTYREIASSFLR